MILLAPTVLRVAPADFRERVRERFAGELRRAGGFAQLCLLGAQACLDAAGREGSLGLLCASRLGALHAVRAALDEGLRRGEPAMPFNFIAMQPHLAGALLAQRGYAVTRTAHLHLAQGSWPLLLRAAQGWLAECERVLLGWVEESDAGDAAHRSDWCLLRREPAAGAARCTPEKNPETAAPATAGDWIARVAAWQAAARGPLALRGDEEAWRFALEQ
ncbi:MAG: hypothetical protein WBO23_03910 [Burkholderiales bacterium]